MPALVSSPIFIRSRRLKQPPAMSSRLFLAAFCISLYVALDPSHQKRCRTGVLDGFCGTKSPKDLASQGMFCAQKGVHAKLTPSWCDSACATRAFREEELVYSSARK